MASAPKGSIAATTLDTARVAYIQTLGSLGSNAEVKAEVTRFREQLDQMQLQMLAPKPRKRPSKSKTADQSSTLTYARWASTVAAELISLWKIEYLARLLRIATIGVGKRRLGILALFHNFLSCSSKKILST